MKIHCIIFFIPHPDDLESWNAHTVLYFMNKGFQIYEILMSGGEYGIGFRFAKVGERIKGLELQKMRAKDNNASKSSYGTFPDGKMHVISIPLHYVDGFVPFTKASVLQIQEILIHIRPDYVFAPDAVYMFERHPDHIATGRNVLFALRSLPPQFLPKEFLPFVLGVLVTSFHFNHGKRWNEY